MIDPAEIRAFRVKHGLSQTRLGALFGVAQATVSMWELGKRQPQPGIERKLAALFGLPEPVLEPEDVPAKILPRRHLRQLTELPRRWRARRQDALAKLRAKPGAPPRAAPNARELNLQADCWYRAARELEDALQLSEEVTS